LKNEMSEFFAVLSCQNWIWGIYGLPPPVVVTAERRRETCVWVETESKHVARARYHEGGEHLVSPSPEPDQPTVEPPTPPGIAKKTPTRAQCPPRATGAES